MTEQRTPVLTGWQHEETYTNSFSKMEFTVTRYDGTGDWYWVASYFGHQEAQGTAETREDAMAACGAWLVEQPYYGRTLKAGKKLLAMLGRIKESE